MSLFPAIDYVKDLFYNAPIPIAYLEPNGTFKKVNHAWATFAGFTEADLVDTLRIHEISHPQDVEANVKMMNKIIFHHRVQPCYVSVSRYLSKDGKAIWGQSFVSVVCDDRGEPKMLLIFVLPLPNHGNFKVAQQSANSMPNAAAVVALRPSITLLDFLKDNWKWFAPIGFTVLVFLIKCIFILADILQRVGLNWKEVLF